MIRTALATLVLLVAPPAVATQADPLALDSTALAQRIEAGAIGAERITTLALERIDRLDPRIEAVIATNPEARAHARASDARRAAGDALGPLDGLPLLVKDNIETRDPMPTTAGSLALAGNLAGRDAPVVARLRAAGMVILGKTNLSEWANIRDADSISGWSAIGGQTRNPHVLDRNPCGSSSGSGAAVAAGFAPFALGTETNGSITCPAAVAGIVGLKPTVGLVPRTHIVPISSSQDTAGPMTRSVADAALLLTAMAGSDPADPATREADARRTDYAAALDPDALAGARLGVLRSAAGFHAATDAVFERALDTLRGQGAELVEIEAFPEEAALGAHQLPILLTELKATLDAYLASTDPERVATRSLAEVIAFNREHAEVELAPFGQSLFEQAVATAGLDDPDYVAHRDAARRIAAGGIDGLLAEHRVVALIAPTMGPAWPTDPVLKDRYVGGGIGNPAAIAGYPHLTVPMGHVRGLPVGLSFVGPAWSEARLLALGHAFEQAAQARVRPQWLGTLR